MSVSVCLSVHLSVTEVHWRIIANLGFKFRSHFTTHCGRGACGREGRDHRREEWRDHPVLLAGTVLLAVLLAGGSSRAMLASTRLSCFITHR